ncbi:MAG: right-handed parallel beta-helix repeat-containing protein [Anaerolineales bacterium]|nr:right-handed parallel beta-helix repeat-containing protein [Anaerolineales bacterium]
MVTPTKAGYIFTPATRNYPNVTSNQSNQNYTAVSDMPVISGNAGVGGAILSYTDGTPKTVTANSSGLYSFQVSNNWSGMVTPSKVGFSFVPGNMSYSNVVSAQTAQDYIARPTAFTFASMADGHAETAYFSTTVNQISTLNPALVLFNGDLEDTGFALTEINPMINALKNANLFNKTFLVRGNADNHISNSAALWENYFETAPNIKVLPPYVTNKVALNSDSDHLTYSFEYGNSIFIGLDVPGDVNYLTSDEIDFLDSRLTYAESQGLTHAFIFFHGPEYCVEGVHCICSSRTDSNCTPPALMTIINNHPIVSATIHGHEHVLSWTHMDNTRVAGLTRSYEQFITSPSGGASYFSYLFPDRVDYAYPDMENSQGFATISVDGLSFTYNMYKVGIAQPVWSHTFSKLNTAPTISDITDKTTDEDTATGNISFTVGDVESSVDYLTVTATSSNTTLVPNGNIFLGGSGANRTVNLTPASNQSGNATITVFVNDGTITASDTFLLTVDPVNDAPVAEAQSVSLSWNTSIDITLTGTDVEGSSLTYSIVGDPAHGSLSGSEANWTYTPTTGYSGADSFTFKVNDGTIDSASAVVNIIVTAYTISGDAGVAGAILSYVDGSSRTVTADGAGLYTFQVPADWSGTVTPSKAGYTFSPTSMIYVNVLADQTAQNYTTTGVTYTISGNAGMAGVTLSYMDGTPKTAIADEDGLYSIEVPYNWSGMVTPSLSGYGFRPATHTYSNLTSNQFAQDYITNTGRVYYVDNTNPACTDSGTVGSLAIPFCTIGRGAYLAVPGQIVHVIHGIYAETVFPLNNGTAGSPITYWADPGVTVTGNSAGFGSAFALGSKSYLVIDGFNITQTKYRGIYVDSSNHITISNNHVTYAGVNSGPDTHMQGIFLRNTTYSTITGNITDHNSCIGIRLINNSDYNLVSNNISFANLSSIAYPVVVVSDAAGIDLTGASNNIVINNTTYSNEDSGINVYVDGNGVPSTNNLIIGNLSYENGDHGIDVNNSPNNTIVGNTVHGNGTVGINVEGEASTGSHTTTIVNNISAGNGFTPPVGSFGGNLRVDSASLAGTTIDYNLFNRESAVVQIIWNDINYASLAAFQTAVINQEVHGREGDPLFVDPVPSALRQSGVPYVGSELLGNYYLSPGSPAIDSANADAPSQPISDIDGNSRVDDPATPNNGVGVRDFDDRGAYEFLPLGQSLPIVTTQAVTSISTTTAAGNGTVTATGEPNPSQHGVVWNTTGGPTTADSKTMDGAVSATGPYASSMSGLTPGVLYYVRAYVTNAMGTVYGDEVIFTTHIMPTVATLAVTEITTSTATGNGNITALGVPNPTQHGVVWSTSFNPTIGDNKTTDGTVSATGAYTSDITGLTAGMLYHVRAYATNAAGTFYGEDVTFTTHDLPAVSTLPVSNITTMTATGNGNVTDLGVPNPSQHGVVWNTAGEPTIADSKTMNGVAAVAGTFTSSMTGLMPGTLYHVRAYATNMAGTVYGEEVTFTTLLAPTVTTQSVTNITTVTALGNGNITVLGTFNPTEHGVVWATTANPTIENFKTMEGEVDETGSFTSTMTGLTPGTLYYVRAYATNEAGTSYGAELSFTTLIAPTITTLPASSIGTTTAIGNGNVITLGVPNPTQHGVVWSTSADPTLANNKTTDGDVTITGAFTSSITGLTPGMLYHVRAYATNAVGTVYGEDVSFTTLPSTTGTTTPNTNPGTGINIPIAGSADWANPDYITADDNSYASVTLTGSVLQSGYLEGTNYGFDIPLDAAINGITVTIGRHESGTRVGYFDVRDGTVKLLKAGTLVGNNKAATGTEWPIETAVPATYGTTADLWGTTWTPAEINANNFGVALSVISDVNRIAYVDYVRISVTYTVTMVGSNTTVSCGSGTPLVTYGSSITCVATVARGSGPKTPTGNVNWTTNGSGNFSASPCTLSGVDGISTCSVTYTPNAVGNGAHLITAAYAGDPNFFTSSDQQSVTVNKATAAIVLGSLGQTYDGTPRSVTAVTEPANLTVDFTYDGLIAAPTDAGSYEVVGTINDPNYNSTSDSSTLVIAKALAVVSLADLSQTYDGAPKLAAATTNPADLTVDFTYDGAAVAPINSGLYAVIGTINDLNYAGSASGTLYVAKAAAVITLGGLNQTYDGTPKSVTIATIPSGLPVEVTYAGLQTPPTLPGSYDVVATINDPNYSGTTVNTLIIVQAVSTHSIPLSIGWNLISFNVHPANTEIATVLFSIDGNYDLVYAWDATSAGDNWQMYDPNVPPFLNNLTHLDETIGFWVHMTAADVLEVVGTEPVTTDIDLYEGWNLVAYPSMTNRPLPEVLNENGCTDFSVVYAYLANDAAPWKLFDLSLPPFLNDLSEMAPGSGYWIWVNADCTWSVTYLAE